MNTTPQTISNYERMGIKDVDVENEISSILGVDLSEETEENGLADLVREVCCLNM
ncbi:hypothetical protein SAMN02910377_01646 [Pseudobutyrivibrio ruminis]|uniref:Uncharacterized protein n=2 Tax=Pseudobutyrivibrio ruminis TaxID=46206 RepID=A0A1H7JCJ6_9FIRM|nr:hypothetical protein SAMN02910377_01646 [Pseudobutyrivibrio ruminis]